MKRLPYFLMTLFFLILEVIVANLLPNNTLMLVVVIIHLITMTFATAQRLKNIGWMPGYAWMYPIPVFNLPLIYNCIFLPMNYVIVGDDLISKIGKKLVWLIILSFVALFLAAIIVGGMNS